MKSLLLFFFMVFPYAAVCFVSHKWGEMGAVTVFFPDSAKCCSCVSR